jgi:hypothetical protein
MKVRAPGGSAGPQGRVSGFRFSTAKLPAGDVFYIGDYGTAVFGNVAPAIGNLFTQALDTGRGGTIIGLASRVTVLAAGGQFRLGVYVVDPVTGYPTKLLFDSGDLSSAAVAVVQAACNIPTSPGQLLALAFNSGTLAASYASRGTPFQAATRGDFATLWMPGEWNVAFAYGAMPDPFPAGGAQVNFTVPLIGAKY